MMLNLATGETTVHHGAFLEGDELEDVDGQDVAWGTHLTMICEPDQLLSSNLI